MRIVIVGAGKLGYSIAEVLSKEDLDVIVVDKDENQLTAIQNTLDVLTITANGSSPITMNDEDLKNSDVLIAVTDSDEINMVCCVLAKKHGIRHTIARVRDMQFISEARDYLKENFDIDLMLNPEQLTAMEITRILMVPSALNVEDYAEGKIRLFEAKVATDSQLANIKLKDLDLPPSILAGMIFRDHQLIIPHGDDVLKPLDNVYFIGIPEEIEKISKRFVHRDTQKIESVAIIGGGRTGRFLAYGLDMQGVDVKVIDPDRQVCRLIAEKLNNGKAICGDGTDIDLLMEEGIGDCDAVACLTRDDKLNLMIALLCKHMGAKKTIVQVNRTQYIDLMTKVGVDIVLSSRMLASSEVLAFIHRGSVLSVSMLEGNRAKSYEVIVPEDSPIAYKKLMNAGLPKECLLAACVRNNEAFIPRGNTKILPGDRIILIVMDGHDKRVISYIWGQSK